MVNFYWTDKEDVITGEVAQEGFDYGSEETEAESSSLAIHQVMDYLVEQIYDNCQYEEYTVEQTEDEIYIKNLDGKILEYYYGFFVDSLIEKAMDDAGLSVREMAEQFEIPINTLKMWVEGRPVSPDWAEGLILEKLESMKTDW